MTVRHLLIRGIVSLNFSRAYSTRNLAKHQAETSQPLSCVAPNLSRVPIQIPHLADSAVAHLPGALVTDVSNMTTRADMSVCRPRNCPHSCAVILHERLIAYGGGSGYAIWRREILLRAGAAPQVSRRSRCHGTGCFRDVVQSRLRRSTATENVRRRIERPRLRGSSKRTSYSCCSDIHPPIWPFPWEEDLTGEAGQVAHTRQVPFVV